jgi:hypothetical protein
MPRKGKGEYPANWKEIATNLKNRHHWICERCEAPHDPNTGHTLTVHHLDLDKSNCEEWNLAVLCQKCHLQIQSKVIMAQEFMFAHSPWFEAHVRGYDQYRERLERECREMELEPIRCRGCGGKGKLVSGHNYGSGCRVEYETCPECGGTGNA